MRKLIPVLMAALLAAGLAGCKRRPPPKVETIEEETSSLATVVHVADPRTAFQLVKGFHGLEQNAWRWTMGKFTVTLRPPLGAAQRGATLQLKFTIAEAVLERLKSMTLWASVGTAALAPETYTSAGEHTYSREVPAKVLAGEGVAVDFTLDKFLPAGSVDQRELGLIVTTVGFEAK